MMDAVVVDTAGVLLGAGVVTAGAVVVGAAAATDVVEAAASDEGADGRAAPPAPTNVNS